MTIIPATYNSIATTYSYNIIPVTKVIDFKTPEELRKLIDLKLQDGGIGDEEILGLCRTVLKYCVNTCE